MSAYYLKFLCVFTKIIGKLKLRLRKIRKTIANKVRDIKNIVNLMNPLMRFAYRKRMEFKFAVMKQVKYMLQMNLLTLLLHRWLKHIKFIQCAFRKYKIVKLARMQVLYAKCVRSEINNSTAWAKAPNALKYQLLNNFIVKQATLFSKRRCKYLYDVRLVNKKFTRNFTFWENDALSNAMGRNFTISLPSPPVFSLFNKLPELMEFMNALNMQRVKRRPVKNSQPLEKSYY